MTRGARGIAHSLPEIILGDTRPALLLVLLAAALLLLITCVNVANLMLVRALSRAKEFVVRAALGANRGRIIAQLLTEGALLSLGGGILGVGLSVAAVRAFVAIAPENLPHLEQIGVHGPTLVAAVLITATAMLLSSLGPALFMSRAEAQDVLRSGSRHSGSRRVRAAAEGLVVAQVALAATSLTAAGLVTRSLVKLEHVDLSFDPGKPRCRNVRRRRRSRHGHAQAAERARSRAGERASTSRRAGGITRTGSAVRRIRRRHRWTPVQARAR